MDIYCVILNVLVSMAVIDCASTAKHCLQIQRFLTEFNIQNNN